jgi:hypothetical protein
MLTQAATIRIDLPGASTDELIEAIANALLQLEAEAPTGR